MWKRPKSQSKWCPLPWTHLAFGVRGNGRVCCFSTQSRPAVPRNDFERKIGLIQKENGEFFNGRKDEFSSILGSSFLDQVRDDNETAAKSPMCQICVSREASGLPSKRQSALREFDAEGEPLLKSVDIRNGSMCNLKCVMCNARESSGWRGDWNRLLEQRESLNPVLKNYVDSISSSVDSENHKPWITPGSHGWNELMKNASHLEEVYFAGGEPLIDSHHRRLLEGLSSRNNRIRLRYNTNLTVFDRSLIDIWRRFERVQLSVSLDGVGRVNDYIRFPSRFETIQDNLVRLDSVGGNVSISITHTVQNLNIYSLSDFYNWLEGMEFRNISRKKVVLNSLYFPTFLRMSNLSESCKREVIRRNQHCPEFKPLEVLLLGAPLPTDRESFTLYFKMLDETRGTTLSEVFPWLELPARAETSQDEANVTL